MSSAHNVQTPHNETAFCALMKGSKVTRIFAEQDDSLFDEGAIVSYNDNNFRSAKVVSDDLAMTMRGLGFVV